jgi:hypothetical protein
MFLGHEKGRKSVIPSDECQKVYIWTPSFTLVRPLVSLCSNTFGVLIFLQVIDKK